MKLAETVTFGGSGLDRAAHLRSDPSVLQTHTGANTIVFWRGKPLIRRGMPDMLARIDVNDPIHGRRIGEVHLRPVNLNHIEELISSNTRSHQIERNRIAKFFAFGPPK